VHQGSGGAVSLATESATAQTQYSDASSYGGSYISLSSVQPGDLVFSGSSASDVEHVGIVVSGTGSSALILSAIDEGDGITDTVSGQATTVGWFEGGSDGFAWTGAVAIPGVGNTTGGGSDGARGDFDGSGSSQALFQDPGSSTWELVTGGGANNSAAGLYTFVTNWQQPA
jgi:hypothetical protein